MAEGGDKAETGRRLTVPEAAAELGTTSEGVRSRIKRGTLRTERESGRVWVILDAPPQPDQPRPDATPTGDQAAARAELVDELHARVASLERQLDQERDANRENRRLLAAALERIPPQLEAPSEPPGDAEKNAAPRPGTPGPPETETRPWWRRVFGG